MYTYPQNGYKTLFDANPFSLIIFEKDSFNILDANSAASELYGYSHSEFLEMKFRDLFCENIPAGLNPAEYFHRKSQVYHKKKNGFKFFVNVKFSEITFEDKPACLLTASPVELKLSGDNLKVFYSAIVDSTDDAVIGKTLDGKIISWNRAAERIYGYRAGEVLGKHISIIAPPDKQSEIDEIMEKLGRGEQIRHFETRRMKKDGKIIWVSVTISPVKDASGKIIGASTIDRNISRTREHIGKLKEDQIIFKHLLENLNEIFYVSDPRKPEIIYMSEAYARVFGENVNTIYKNPTSYLNFIAPEDQGKAYRALSKQMKGIATDYIYSIKRSDGKTRYLHERAFPVKDDSGEVFRVIGIAEDITESLESGELIRRNEYRYQSIFESSAVSMWETDFSGVRRLLNELKKNGIINFREYFSEHPEFVNKCYESVRLINVNPQTIKMFGAESKSQVINDFKRVRSPEVLPIFTEILVMLGNGGHHFETEFELKTFNESPIHVYAIISFPEEDAPYKYAVASLIDITERILTERALSESEQRFRVMADTAPVFIWTAGMDKGFYYFNRSWLDFRGKTLEDELGYGWMKGIHSTDLALFIESYESSFDDRSEFSVEYRMKRFDGEYRWILNHGVPRYSGDGIFQGYIGSGIDITERKRNEVELSNALSREKNALNQAEQVQRKLEFLAEASYILNSSLNYSRTIKSLAELLTPAICDWFAVDLINDQKRERLLIYHKDPDKVKIAWEIEKKYPGFLNSRAGVAKVIRTGKSEVYKELTNEFPRSSVEDEEVYNFCLKLELKSAMIVPLIVRDKVLGAMTLCTAESGRIYDESDLKFADDIANRAAVAIENATLFRRIEELNKNLEATIEEQLREIKIRTSIEKELRESEERAKLITENSNDFISLHDENDIYIYANPAITNVLGYAETDLVGNMRFGDLVHPGDKESVKSCSKHSLTELRCGKKDGEYVWIESSSLKVNYHGKKITIRISRDITERKRIENERIKLYAQIEAQRVRIDNLVSNVPGVVWEARGTADAPNRKIDFISSYVEKLLGYPVAEWLNTSDFWLKVIHPDDRQSALREAANNYRNKKGGINRYRWVTREGAEIWIESQTTCITDENGNATGMRGVMMDVTEQIKFEQQISASLREKEVLLKEIHHRVKNNLQVISSLLSLQSKTIPDKHVQELFDESRNRIRSMALIHEKLYQSKNLFEIDFYGYVTDLINNLMISYGISKQSITSNIRIEDISFDIDSAITLGLIINELASNSFKHAFKASRKGIFEVSVNRKNGNYVLRVKDNGAGIPGGLDIKKNESLGLQLVDTLIEQLYGNFQINSNEGTEVLIEFPDPAVNEVKTA